MAKLEVKRNPRRPEQAGHKSGPVKEVPHAHPLHAADADHRKMPMKDKYDGAGPHVNMPDHQHPLHHPHTDVVEKHKHSMLKDSY